MQIQITTEKGTVDVTGLVPTVKWSGDFRQVARAFSIVASAADDGIAPSKDGTYQT